MPAPKSVLIVEDNEDQRSVLAVMVTEWGYRAETAHDGQEAIEKLAAVPVHVVLTDVAMPRVDGVELLRWLARHGHNPPAIVMTAYGDMQKAVSMVHDLGAFWFLEKPFDYEALRVLLERAVDHSSLTEEKERLQRRLAYSGVLGDMIGCSPAMQHIFSLVQQAAPTRASILITGESGTGKEIVAHTIHKLSPRRDGPFVAVNCAALPETLIESELFGHEKGSFTGAAERRAGCFELAQGGTLLLDEIGEMAPGTQAKLLRVLEDGRVRRLGGKSEVPIDVRVVAATNKVPELAINKGELRQDLYYRLNVFHISLPPLRNRREDIAAIAEGMLPELNKKHSCHISGLAPEVLERFAMHDWPGNVRELRNVLERAVIIAGDGLITLDHLPAPFQIKPAMITHPQDPDAIMLRTGATLAEAEKSLILKTLEHTRNNKTRAADILGISLKTLHNKLKEYNSTAAA